MTFCCKMCTNCISGSWDVCLLPQHSHRNQRTPTWMVGMQTCTEGILSVCVNISCEGWITNEGVWHPKKSFKIWKYSSSCSVMRADYLYFRSWSSCYFVSCPSAKRQSPSVCLNFFNQYLYRLIMLLFPFTCKNDCISCIQVTVHAIDSYEAF